MGVDPGLDGCRSRAGWMSIQGEYCGNMGWMGVDLGLDGCGSRLGLVWIQGKSCAIWVGWIWILAWMDVDPWGSGADLAMLRSQNEDSGVPEGAIWTRNKASLKWEVGVGGGGEGHSE